MFLFISCQSIGLIFYCANSVLRICVIVTCKYFLFDLHKVLGLLYNHIFFLLHLFYC